MLLTVSQPETSATEAINAPRQIIRFGFVMFIGGMRASDVLGTVDYRMHNDVETERKVLRNELAKINRTRLERMLGPEGGYHNW